jgi:hypothetical protein
MTMDSNLNQKQVIANNLTKKVFKEAVKEPKSMSKA